MAIVCRTESLGVRHVCCIVTPLALQAVGSGSLPRYSSSRTVPYAYRRSYSGRRMHSCTGFTSKFIYDQSIAPSMTACTFIQSGALRSIGTVETSDAPHTHTLSHTLISHYSHTHLLSHTLNVLRPSRSWGGRPRGTWTPCAATCGTSSRLVVIRVQAGRGSERQVATALHRAMH
jgi:hypothetical protein